jgi:hypothetical protein
MNKAALTGGTTHHELLTTVERRAVEIMGRLRSGESISCTTLGEQLWPTRRSGTCPCARPAGSVLHRLRRLGLVIRVIGEYRDEYSLTRLGRAIYKKPYVEDRLSRCQRRLLLAMEPGRIYTRATDPCRMIRSCTIRVLRRLGIIERVVGTVEWSYRLTPAGEAARASLRTPKQPDEV